MTDFAFHELTKIRKHHGEDDWPRLLQEAFNSAFPPNGWNCLIGRDFTAEFFTHRWLFAGLRNWSNLQRCALSTVLDYQHLF
uniref:Uncharacterized protein n=1 Tax=Ditylenchus dipsaci TaxID=166011 RepID=A0A915D6W6_9BILA